MKKLLFALLIIGLFFGFTSCNIINPAEPIPTYIRIDSMDLVSVDPSVHGSVSEKITDAWVYVDNHNVGNFELPANIPVLLENDSAEIAIYAGIKSNGQDFFRRRYVFYEPHIQRIGKSLETQKIIPQIQYRTGLTFRMDEDFENGNSFLPYFGPDTTIKRTSDPNYVFEGTGSGLIWLTNTERGARSITTQEFTLPTDRESFLEMDYKNNIIFTLEVQIVTFTNTVIVTDLLNMNIREDWNKIYINLTEVATTYPGSKVNFILKAFLTPGQTAGFVAIDNFKILSQ